MHYLPRFAVDKNVGVGVSVKNIGGGGIPEKICIGIPQKICRGGPEIKYEAGVPTKENMGGGSSTFFILPHPQDEMEWNSPKW